MILQEIATLGFAKIRKQDRCGGPRILPGSAYSASFSFGGSRVLSQWRRWSRLCVTGLRREESDEIETAIVVLSVHVMRSGLGAAPAERGTIDGIKKYFARHPVPSYGHRYAGTIFVVPARRGLRLSQVWIRTGG